MVLALGSVDILVRAGLRGAHDPPLERRDRHRYVIVEEQASRVRRMRNA